MAILEHDAEVFHEWADEQSAAARSRISHEPSIAYGKHPRQILDVYYPKHRQTQAPVVAFIHGGGFKQGFPARFGYVAGALTSHGAITVSIGYRLIPDGVSFPDSSEDVEAALAWIHRNIAERGGNPGRIYLAGHSSGAMLAADIAFRQELTKRGLPGDLINGLVLLGGAYRSDQLPEGMANRRSERYLGDLRGTLPHLPPHTIVAAGTREQLPFTLPEARALSEAIASKGGSAELIELQGCDHLHTLDSLASADGEVFRAVKRMMGI